MTFSTLRRLAALAAALLLGLAPAQELSADEVLEHVKSEAETLQDAQFTVTGSLTDADGTTLPLELYVQTIARQFNEEKREISRLLRRSGIGTLFTTPANLTLDVLNRYLELKAQGVI